MAASRSQSAGTVDALPFSGENNGGVISGADGSNVEGEIDTVGGEYLQTMGVRLLEGRWFREEEMAESNDAVIVNDRSWPPVCGPARTPLDSGLARLHAGESKQLETSDWSRVECQPRRFG